MPKIKHTSLKYTVSFNGSFGGEEYGDEYMHTADFEGNDIDELVAEVIADDPNFPMTFRRNGDQESAIIGQFWSVEKNPKNEYAVAVMVLTDVYF